MTYYHIDVMWAIALFGILLWTTVAVILNAALRRGMGIMGMVLSYGVLAWMVLDLPVVDALATWMFFAVTGGVVMCAYELWARRRYAGSNRTPRPLIRVAGIVSWPALIPDALGLVFNDMGILPTDDRSETHAEDALRTTDDRPVER
jgi:hypothetical protein